MKAKLTIAAALTVLSALPVAAQRVISPGMTTEQVRGVFGSPARTRDEGDWTYWFYSNGCPVRCGSDDVVFFRGEKVVAAVLRTRARRIASPPAADALDRAGGDDGYAVSAGGGAAETDAQGRVIVKGRSRERDGTLPPPATARVGGVTIEVEGTPPPARSGSDLARDNADTGQATVIRSGNGRPASSPGVITSPVQTPVPLSDTAGANATTVDDARAARESQVTRTTVPNQSDTIQARRRARETGVTPRVVPRP